MKIAVRANLNDKIFDFWKKTFLSLIMHKMYKHEDFGGYSVSGEGK